MCTLLLSIRPGPDVALIGATNRDERLDRPASGPHWWPTRPGAPRIWAPRDEVGGGTWVGLNSAGLFVAVTNRFGVERDAQRRSRGLVVLDALSHRSAAEAAAYVAGLDPMSVNPFHLVMVDQVSAELVWHDARALRREALEPGLHIITERSRSSHEDGRAAWLKPRVEALEAAGRLTADALGALLDTHAGRGLDDPRVWAPEWGYGTRTRTLVELPRARRQTRFEVLDLEALRGASAQV